MLEELENFDLDSPAPDSITILPPENANEELTDEDSGDENFVTPNNLPGSQLRAEANLSYDGESQQDEEQWDSDDEIPLSSFATKKKKLSIKSKSRKKPTVKWSDVELTNTFPNWLDVCGPKVEKSPLELFMYFFDKDIVQMLINYTNIYAAQKNQTSTVAEEEFYCFLGVLILSGYAVVNRRKMYWQNRPDANNPLVCESISRDRFQYIMSNLHCNDNTQLSKDEKFSKMRPLFDGLNQRFRLFAPEEENHSVDEAMVPYYGRHGCKQFIRGKPIRWGYKFWAGTTRLGYIVWFDPYQGSTAPLHEKYKDQGLGASVILQYVDVLTSETYRPYHIFCDNFFTSYSLLEVLKDRGIKCTGTIRENRIPSDPLESSKTLKKKSRGTFCHKLGNETILLCKWNDNNVANIATNFLSVSPVNKVKRYSRAEKKHVNVDQPYLIQMYNQNMGGVDRSDQNISLNRISIRGKKWYFPLFCHCIDMAIQNAWQLHRINLGKLDQLAFRRSIATNLLETYKKSSRRGPSRPSQSEHEFSRFDRLDHLVEYQNKRTRCRICHKNSFFRCKKCSVGLHPKDCFILYHTL